MVMMEYIIMTIIIKASGLCKVMIIIMMEYIVMKIIIRGSWSLEIIMREIAIIEIIFRSLEVIAMGSIVMKISMDTLCQENHCEGYYRCLNHHQE